MMQQRVELPAEFPMQRREHAVQQAPASRGVSALPCPEQLAALAPSVQLRAVRGQTPCGAPAVLGQRQQHVPGQHELFRDLRVAAESESECKCLTCNQKPTGSQFSLLHEPN